MYSNQLQQTIEKSNRELHNILLIPICGLGDAVLYLPTVAAIRRRYPVARILVIVATDEAATLIRLFYTDIEVQVFNRSQNKGLLSILKIIWKIHSRHFDITISRGSLNSIRIPILALLSGAKVRVGGRSERLSFLYTHRIDVSKAHHVSQRYQHLISGIGIIVEDSEYYTKLAIPSNEKPQAEEWWKKAGLDSANKVAVLASGADINVRGRWNPSLKRWHANGYAEVAKWLAERGCKVVICGSPYESALASDITTKSKVPIVDLCGRTSVRQLIWLLAKSDVVVCNDTGTMHLASALGTKVIALFGPTSPCQFGPLGNIHQVIRGEAPCAPCFPLPTCSLARCRAMESIQPVNVTEALRRVLYHINGKTK